MILFFSAVCSSFTGFIQKLEDPKKSLEICQTQKIAEICETQKNSKKFCQPRKIGFGQISNPKK